MDKLQRCVEIVSGHMEAIVGQFKDGAKITVIVRRPGKPDQDFLMTDDVLPEVAQLIQRRIMAAQSEEARRG